MAANRPQRKAPSAAGERRQRIVAEQHALQRRQALHADRGGREALRLQGGVILLLQDFGQLAADHVALVRPVFDAEGALMLEDRAEADVLDARPGRRQGGELLLRGLERVIARRLAQRFEPRLHLLGGFPNA